MFKPVFKLDNFRTDLTHNNNANIMIAAIAITNNLSGTKTQHTFQKIYDETERGDITLYLALHFLIACGQVKGISPYHEDFNHNCTYSLEF
jgi:hypothetical protein